MIMSMFTMQTKKVIETIYSTEYDGDYIQEYSEFEFNGVKYGKLPKFDKPELISLGYYPIFNESYRPILNGKIIDQYWNREISGETIDEWLLFIRRRMDQIMPYYNQLYESTLIEFNPLLTIDMDTTRTDSGTSDAVVESSSGTETNTNSKSRAVASQFPQTMLSGSEDYATSATDTNGQVSVDGKASSDSSTKNRSDSATQSKTKGYQGSASDLLLKFRSTIINIDSAVIADIENCFMLVLNTGDSYTERGWY